MLPYPDAPAETGCEDIETTVRKRRVLFTGFVARMENERLSKLVIYGEVDGGKGYSGGQEQDRMACLQHDLSLFNLPTEAKHWTLAAKKPGEWFRPVEDAADQYMKRWFVTEKEQVANRRTLEVQTAQKYFAEPKASGGGRKRSRVEGGVATAARLCRFEKVTEAAET